MDSNTPPTPPSPTDPAQRLADLERDIAELETILRELYERVAVTPRERWADHAEIAAQAYGAWILDPARPLREPEEL